MSALTGNSPIAPSALFAYGTLMQGQPQHALLQEAGVISVLPASIAGELVDVGEYPALRLSPYITSRVHGQLIGIEKLDTVLDRLDGYEGPEFKRELVNVTLDDGRTHTAFTYVLASDVVHTTVIPSGRWIAKAAGA